MVEELAATNHALTERFEVIRSSAAFQNELIRLQLEGKSLAHVAAKAAKHVAADVLILDANLAIEGAVPERKDLTEALRETLKTAIRKLKSTPAQSASIPFDGAKLLLRSASAGGETLGYAALLCRVADEGVELALSQICTATSLHLIERRAAGRARAETLSAVVWDLLEGSDEVRRFAMARLRDLHVDLDGRQRVYLCKLGGIEHHAASEGWSVNDLNVCRRRTAQAHREVAGFGRLILAGMRGNTLALICGGAGVTAVDRLGADLARAISLLVAQSRRPGLGPVSQILAINPGIPFDPATWPYVAYKGGSEPGVISTTWYLRRSDGRAFVLSIVLNDPKGEISTLAEVSVAQAAVKLLAKA